MASKAEQLIVVIQAEGLVGSLALRTAPMPAADALTIASRMWESPTPARIEPATPERLDAYPSIPSTGAMAEFLRQRPAVIRWIYRSGPLPGPCN
jgi:hypothetical protein